MGALAKVCAKCAADVAGKPRVKGAKGRYVCRPCFDAHAAARGAHAGKASAAPSGRGDDEPVRIAGIHDDGVDGGGGGGVRGEGGRAAALDDNAMIFDLAPVGGGVEGQGGPCPGCGYYLKGGLKGGVVLCVNCGFNTQTGQSLSTSVGVDKVKATTRETERERHLKQTSRDAHRSAYIRAIGTIVFGVVATLIILGTMTEDFARSAAFVGLTMGICIPAAFVAFLLFALAGQAGGVGFLLILLEIAGVCCGYMPLLVLELMFPMPRMVRYGLRALVLGGLSYWLLDMDEPANFVFAFVVFVLMIGSAVASAVILGG